MIWIILKYILIFILAVSAVLCLYASIKNGKKLSMMALKDSLHLFVRTKLSRVVGLSLVFLLAFSFMKYYYNSEYPVMYVSLNYEEAAKGLNPNGTRFNASEIFSDEILSEVIQKGGFDTTVDELRPCLSLATNYDDVSVDTSDLTRLNIATDYRLVFSPDLSTAGIDGKTLMNLIADTYYEHFINTKTENLRILSLDLSDYKENDYHAVADYLGVQASKLQHYLDIYSQENSNFHTDDGVTFAGLSGKIQNFKDVELERFDSFVIENGLSENPDDFVKTIDYKNKLLKLEADKDMASYNVRIEAIDMYDRQMAKAVLVPTQDENMEYYMSRTKIGTDDFANEAQEDLASATALYQKIEENTYAQEKVSLHTATSEQYQQADELVDSFKTELEELSEESRSIVSAYLETKRKTYIETGISERSALSMISLKKGLIFTVLFGVFLSCFYIFSLLTDKNKMKRRTL